MTNAGLIIALKIISHNLGDGAVTKQLRGEFVKKVMEKLDENPVFNKDDLETIAKHAKKMETVETVLAERLIKVVEQQPLKP